MAQEVVTYLTILSGVLGAFWGLFQYTKSQRIKAAEMLLNIEEEFRTILPTFELIEIPNQCDIKINPLLQKVSRGEKLEDDNEIQLITNIDRSLRFFFLCIVLDKDLAVTTKAVRYAYYHYLAILAEPPSHATELSGYLETYYPRLSKWLKVNRKSLKLLSKTGKWKSNRRIVVEGIWSRFKMRITRPNKRISAPPKS